MFCFIIFVKIFSLKVWPMMMYYFLCITGRFPSFLNFRRRRAEIILGRTVQLISSHLRSVQDDATLSSIWDSILFSTLWVSDICTLEIHRHFHLAARRSYTHAAYNVSKTFIISLHLLNIFKVFSCDIQYGQHLPMRLVSMSSRSFIIKSTFFRLD